MNSIDANIHRSGSLAEPFQAGQSPLCQHIRFDSLDGDELACERRCRDLEFLMVTHAVSNLLYA